MSSEEIPEALFRFFEAMPREGPGSAAATRSVLEVVRPLLPPEPRAADMGCGSGAASLVLAEEGVQVIGVDVWRPLLEQLEAAATARGLAGRITVREASMLESGIAAGSLQLVWAEGSVFTVGFDLALECFGELLAPGGVTVVSECCWLVDEPPEEARTFWNAAYPAMRTVEENLAAARAAGWVPLETRTLPPEAWEEEFYVPMEALMARLDHDPELQPVIEENRREIDLFRSSRGAYGYVFFALQRPGG